MALNVKCPNGHQLVLKDIVAGKRINCPRCKTSFIAEEEGTAIPSAPPRRAKAAAPAKRRPREDDDEDDRPRKKRPPAVEDDDADDGDSPETVEERRKARVQEKRRRLKLVHTGLLLHLIKLWIYIVLILAAFMMFLFTVVIATARGAVEQDLSPEAIALFGVLVMVFAIATLIGVIVAPIIGVVGSGFCISVPPKSEGRMTILTSFVFDIIPMIGSLIILLAYFEVFGADPAKNARLNDLIQMGSAFFTLAAWFLFMVFLRQLGYYLKKPSLGNEALNLIAFLIVFVILAPIDIAAMFFLSPMIVGFGGAIFGIIFLFLLVLGWFASFYYLFFVGMIRLLQGIRTAIEEQT